MGYTLAPRRRGVGVSVGGYGFNFDKLDRFMG